MFPIQFRGVKALIVGADYPTFQIYWRYYGPAADLDVVGFVACTDGDPPCRNIKGHRDAAIPVYPLHELESVIAISRVAKCIIHSQNLPMTSLHQILNRIVSTGRTAIEFLPPAQLEVRSCKPVILVTSIARQLGKTQLCRYCSALLHRHEQKVAIIVPVFDASDCGVHHEISRTDPIPNHVLSQDVVWQVQQYQHSGAFRVFVTSDIRRALIRAEQLCDVIIYDSLLCETPQVRAVIRICLCGDAGDCSLWPGPVNVRTCEHVAVVTTGTRRLDDARRLHWRRLLRGHDVMFINSLGIEALDRAIPPGATARPDADVIIVSLPRDIDEVLVPGTSPEIDDYDGSVTKLLGRFFGKNRKPPLQSHFEAQVDVLMAMVTATDRELHVADNANANREACCRSFLASHLPPNFRVTTGEIVDTQDNKTGRLDVVIVNEFAPVMTISDSVIAPILADLVLGVLEVKTSLTGDSLRKALSALRPVKALMPVHGTLRSPNGEITDDPLHGKIITGIFAFNPAIDADRQILENLRCYPNVADFIVLPESFAYFSAETLRVCGFGVQDADVVNGYVRYTARGMGLAIIFGILNSIAAIRRFSGSNCIRYLSGHWGRSAEPEDKVTRKMPLPLHRFDGITSSTSRKPGLFAGRDKLTSMFGQFWQGMRSNPVFC